ncbi:MAG: hypothetical protein A2283_02165 [Lentisphaerae bacterium RIFOXYA12_FULL_48_11]|nr:MAG: hypothetical protein A2283_02165 [Lentisphaerae bacterium RIFOXYA12_FULL_48_11]
MPVVSADDETEGILLSDELLADKTISLESKVVYKIVEQDIGSAKRFTTITNETIAQRLAFSFGTISTKLKELSNKRRIGIASENKVVKRKANSTPLNNQHPTGFRYIYPPSQSLRRDMLPHVS